MRMAQDFAGLIVFGTPLMWWLHGFPGALFYFCVVCAIVFLVALLVHL